MATAPSRMVAYLPSLRTFLHRLRATTSTPSSLASTLLSSPLLTAPPLAPSLAETGVEEDTPVDFSKYSNVLRQSDTVAKLGLQPGLVLPGAVGTLVSSSTGTATEEEKEEEEEGGRDQGGAERDNTAVECLVQECPSFLHAGLMQLFPGVTLSTEKLTVITVSERTNHDMMAWSHDMEEEREELMEHFVNSAKEICSRIFGAGHWADFIDPSSGRPYFGAYTNETLFETDERYRYFGFDVLDVGCCKCISHPLWGTFAFIGTIFTDAPTNSPAIQQILTL